jgi:hypothetical protein
MSGLNKMVVEIMELLEADRSVTEISNMLCVTPTMVEYVATEYLGYIDDSEAP